MPVHGVGIAAPILFRASLHTSFFMLPTSFGDFTTVVTEGCGGRTKRADNDVAQLPEHSGGMDLTKGVKECEDAHGFSLVFDCTMN